MLIRMMHVCEFLESTGFYRLRNYNILDVPFTNTTWTDNITDVDLDEDNDWVSLNDIGRWWSTQDGGPELFARLYEWARAKNYLAPPSAAAE